MFLPSPKEDVLPWLSLVSDPEATKKKIEELEEISNVSKKNFEDAKSALVELERSKREFEEEKTKFNIFIEDKTNKIQNVLDDLYARRDAISAKENRFSQKEQELLDSLSSREADVSNRESILYSKERSIDLDLTRAKEIRSELEDKLARLQTIKDLLN